MTERPELHELESATGIHSRVRYLFAAQFVSRKRVLDIACGNGWGTVVLADAAASVVGADTSAESIGNARAQFARPNVEYRHLTGSGLEFPDGDFDVVVCLETLEHVAAADQSRFLAELRRVLKRDGVLVLSIPDRDTERRYELATAVSNPWHLHTPSREELKQKLIPFGVPSDYLEVDLIASMTPSGALPAPVTLASPLPRIHAPIAVVQVCGADATRIDLPAIARREPRLESIEADVRQFMATGSATTHEGTDVVVTAIVPARGQANQPASGGAAAHGVRARGDFQYLALITSLMRAPSVGDLSGFDAEGTRDVLAARLAFVQHELTLRLDQAGTRVRELEGRVNQLLQTRPMLSVRAVLRWFRDSITSR